MDIDLGDAPTWIAALAAIVAFPIAASTWRISVKDRQRSHAEMVTIWPTNATIADPKRAPRNRTYQALRVANWGRLPVVHVFVVVEATPGVTTHLDHLPVLEPGDSHTFDLPADLHITDSSGAGLAVVTFRDAAGRSWKRDGAGGLEQREQ